MQLSSSVLRVKFVGGWGQLVAGWNSEKEGRRGKLKQGGKRRKGRLVQTA